MKQLFTLLFFAPLLLSAQTKIAPNWTAEVVLNPNRGNKIILRGENLPKECFIIGAKIWQENGAISLMPADREAEYCTKEGKISITYDASMYDLKFLFKGTPVKISLINSGVADLYYPIDGLALQKEVSRAIDVFTADTE